ncbi:MAG: FAD:protein FMN transferase [Bacteroidales bacterium]
MFRKSFQLLLPILLLTSSCVTKKAEFSHITGFTQGTTYSITFESRFKTGSVQAGIEKILHDIDMSLSIYNDSSIISKMNRNVDVLADAYFIDVFNKSEELSELSGGAFDITVGPLVRSWGFGPDNTKSFRKEKLDSLLKLVGYRKIKLVNRHLVKDDPAIFIDVNAIAQGYTVDVVARYLSDLGMKNFLVEIGGEVRVKGKKGDVPWKIGIDKPFDNNLDPGSNLQAIIKLTDEALATSGNYRKFYVEDGVKYSHTIDPATGYPAKNTLLSATILAPDCTTADGVATACMVLGLEKAINLVSEMKGIEAYFVYSDLDGNYAGWISRSLNERIEELK